MRRTTQAIASIMLMFATVLVMGCTEKDTTGTEFTDDWVDLGLPSGLLWATRNVGASSPTDYGNYYAWGETSPKSVYDWSTYRYARYDSDEDDYEMTKYTLSDSLSTLQPGDDVATANYGGRTPTKEEWEELINNTTSQWVTMNDGVYGRCFTASNGNSLFLPAAGDRSDSSLENVGNVRLYWSSSLSTIWSSSLYTLGPHRAWFCHLTSGSVNGRDPLNRIVGLSVRAVRQP